MARDRDAPFASRGASRGAKQHGRGISSIAFVSMRVAAFVKHDMQQRAADEYLI